MKYVQLYSETQSLQFNQIRTFSLTSLTRRIWINLLVVQHLTKKNITLDMVRWNTLTFDSDWESIWSWGVHIYDYNTEARITASSCSVVLIICNQIELQIFTFLRGCSVFVLISGIFPWNLTQGKTFGRLSDLTITYAALYKQWRHLARILVIQLIILSKVFCHVNLSVLYF